MGALTDLWKSERGLIALVLIIASTVLCAIHVLTMDQWVNYTEWIFGMYAAAKTITTSVATAASAVAPSAQSATTKEN